MRFDEGSDDHLIGVALLEASDDVLLASRQGKAIRFAGDDVREFTSRTSTGVRGMTLKDGATARWWRASRPHRRNSSCW